MLFNARDGHAQREAADLFFIRGSDTDRFAGCEAKASVNLAAPTTPRTLTVITTNRNWANHGLKLGKMYEAKLLVEAGGGAGSIDFTSTTVTAK